MNSTATLTGSHLRTYKTIFQHPISHNLGWHDVHALFRQLGQVDEEANGNLKVTRNGQIMVLHPARGKDVSETDEIMILRRFLERSEPTRPGTNGHDAQWLLVIDHRHARIFRTDLDGASPQHILAPEPEDHSRAAPVATDSPRAQENPDPNSFFKRVAAALPAAGKILVFGSGTGRSSEMDQFTAWLKLHHADLAKRITGSQVVDEHHLTQGQLLAKAREFHGKVKVV